MLLSQQPITLEVSDHRRIVARTGPSKRTANPNRRSGKADLYPVRGLCAIAVREVVERNGREQSDNLSGDVDDLGGRQSTQSPSSDDLTFLSYCAPSIASF